MNNRKGALWNTSINDLRVEQRPSFIAEIRGKERKMKIKMQKEGDNPLEE